jgi:hypothetical protein
MKGTVLFLFQNGSFVPLLNRGNRSFKKRTVPLVLPSGIVFLTCRKTHPCFFNNGLFYEMGFVNWENF